MKMSKSQFDSAHDRWLDQGNPANELENDEERTAELRRELERDLEDLHTKYDSEGLDEDHIFDVVSNFG